MNRFEYREARTIDEAVETLSRDDGGRLLAGTTDFLIRWRQGAWKPRYVLNIKRIPGLNEVHFSPDEGLRLGTLVNIRTLEQHPLIRQHYPALTQAATAFAGVQIRNLATVGGNVCNASPAGDTLPALLAYGAVCHLAGPSGMREVPLAGFFRGPSQTELQPAELLVELRLPPPLPRTGALYIKHSPRSTMDIATAGVASVVSLEGEVCQQVRIVLGAVAPTVIRASEAEALLTGHTPSAERLQQAAQAAVAAASPIDDIRGTAYHRRAIVAPLVQRTFHYAVQMAQGANLSFETQRGLAVEAVF
ncbi:dehydrogenase [Candidatus Entotheonella serta]|nr:dehydrogenase [Candidatus Entotheonella serta]